MLKITEKEWQKVLDKYQEKIDEINLLNREIIKLSSYIKEDSKEITELEKVNSELTIENKKLKDKIHQDEYVMKTVLEKLNCSLNTIEQYSLKNRISGISSKDLDLLV